VTLTAATRLAAVVGRPIRHSLSPVLHNAWLEAAGLDGAYVALSVSEGRFGAFVEAFRGGSLAGVNVTLPFKTEALAAADNASERALAAGAANLLLFDPDGCTPLRARRRTSGRIMAHWSSSGRAARRGVRRRPSWPQVARRSGSSTGRGPGPRISPACSARMSGWESLVTEAFWKTPPPS